MLISVYQICLMNASIYVNKLNWIVFWVVITMSLASANAYEKRPDVYKVRCQSFWFTMTQIIVNCLRLSMSSKLYWWLWGLWKSCLSMRGKIVFHVLIHTRGIRFKIKENWTLTQNIESNPDWNDCIDANSITMGRCVHGCDGDESCENDCLAGFKDRQLHCPCEVNP